MEDKNYSINEIAKFCNLSQKQVRYYEERGLIDNVPRNPLNNYRCYTKHHIKQLLIIREYLTFGFSLDEIYELLHESSVSILKKSIRKRLSVASSNLKSYVLEYEKNVNKFAQIMEAASLLEANVNNNKNNRFNSYEVVEYSEKEVIAVNYKGTFDSEYRGANKNLAELYIIAEEYELTLLGPLMFKHFNMFNNERECVNYEQREIEINFPVLETNSDCSYYKKIPEFKGVSTVHFGEYNKDIIEEYKNLKQWGLNQGYKLSNNSIEEYLIGTEMTINKDLWVTRLIIPIID